MEATINILVHSPVIQKNTDNTWKKILAMADNQADNKTIWFLVSLIFQGVLFLPIPVVLTYYYNAPIIVLPVTFGLYLGNIIIGMGGSGIRVVLGFIALSVMVNLSMLAIYIL